VADWEITLDARQTTRIIASATDKAGNLERTGHEVVLALPAPRIAAK
jgi:hypothetical protein